MKTIIIVAILLLFVTQAQAISTNFFIFFDEHNSPFQHADWSGMYTITDGKLTAFSALIGVCANPLTCTWDRLFEIPPGSNPGVPGSPAGIIENHVTNAEMDYIPANVFISQNTWITVNDDDTQFEREGVYIVAATPEPSTIWLLLSGSLALLRMKLKKQ